MINIHGRIHAANQGGLASDGLAAYVDSRLADLNIARVGTGQPNGVVTAPVGTQYIDTDGTAGAWRWLKTSGTGNTGWTCTWADTGRRNLNAAVTNVSSGSAFFRHKGGWNFLTLQNVAPSTSGSVPLIHEDTGILAPWAPNGGIAIGESVTSGASGATRRIMLASTGRLFVYEAVGGEVLNGVITWPHERAQPSTLPGTPA